MKSFKMHEAKTNLSKIVEMVEAGETIQLKRRDKVVAKIVPVRADREGKAKRKLGMLSHKYKLPGSFEKIDRELDEKVTDFLVEGD